MHLTKFLTAILSVLHLCYTVCARRPEKSFCLTWPLTFFAAQGRRLDDYSSEDERMNEISIEDGRKLIMPIVDRIFSSAETQTQIKVRQSRPNKIKREGDAEETTKSSKHAHSMITSMLSFVSSVVNFGRTMMRSE